VPQGIILDQQNKFTSKEAALIFDAIRKNPRSAVIELSLGILNADKEGRMGMRRTSYQHNLIIIIWQR
jgi:hypothetical protein